MTLACSESMAPEEFPHCEPCAGKCEPVLELWEEVYGRTAKPVSGHNSTAMPEE